MTTALTPNRIKSLKLPAGSRQKLYTDAHRDSPVGFGVLVGKTRKSYVIQRKGHGRRVLGHYPETSLSEARHAAQETAREWETGIAPQPNAKGGWTLQKAVDHHAQQQRDNDCSPLTIKQMYDELGRFVPDWMGRPLKTLTPADMQDRAARVHTNHGKYSAIRFVRTVKAVYNSSLKRYRDLPPNPATAVDLKAKKYRSQRRQEPIAWEDLPAWAKTVNEDPRVNEVRADWYWFVLLTGLRDNDARTVRWEHVDFEAGTIHRPKPKGGEDRAFTVPVSEPVLAILRRRRERNAIWLGEDDQGWVFPSRARQGGAVKNLGSGRPRGDDGKDLLPSPHRLRDTFASAAWEADIHPLTLKVLMNHTLPNAASGDVTEGYIRVSGEKLRNAAERIAVFILTKATPPTA
jgi:integrase